MTTAEILKKYTITLVEHNGQEALKISSAKKLTSAQADEIRAAKPEIIAELKRQAVEMAAEKATQKAAAEAEKRSILTGEKTIAPTYHDGEYLSGYMVFGQEARLLEELGLAKYVSGWGYHVEHRAILALGSTFTYPAALEYTRPAREEKAAKKAAQAAERAGKFRQARETGSRVEISRYSAECNDPHEECSMDIVTVWAMPDGTEKTTRQHTW